MTYRYIIAIMFVASIFFLYYTRYYRPTLTANEYITYYKENQRLYQYNFEFEHCKIDVTIQPSELRKAQEILTDVSSDGSNSSTEKILYFIFEYESFTGENDSLTIDKLHLFEKSIFLKKDESEFAPILFIPENIGFQSKKQRFFMGFELDKSTRPFGDFTLICKLPCVTGQEGLPLRISPKMVPYLHTDHNNR